MQHLIKYKFLVFTILMFISPLWGQGQAYFNTPEALIFMKREINAGVHVFAAPEREELLTDETLYRFEQILATGGIFFESNNYVFLPFRQDMWSYRIEAGPIIGKGEFADSSAIKYIDAETSPVGLRLNGEIDFSTRYYWDDRNYTVVSINAWGNYDAYIRNAEGTLIDSNQVVHIYTDDESRSKLRYGFQAKAGWGIGRLNAVNHFAAAQRLLETHYQGKIFSAEEIMTVARAIGQIKHQREILKGHSAEVESRQLAEFMNNKLLLVIPEGMEDEWELTEYRIRYQGSRLEMGPFFNYFNREPDFVYGGYIRYENHKYHNQNLNSNLAAGINYNGYKKDDWITFEATAGWSWYPSFRHEIGFGVRYLPGMVFKSIDDLQPLHHAIIPYLEYYTQLNSKYRIETAFAYRIANKDEFIMPGPELSVSLYRSWY